MNSTQHQIGMYYGIGLLCLNKGILSMAFKPVFTITNRITAGFTLIERAGGFLEAATLSENWVQAMGGQKNNGIRVG